MFTVFRDIFVSVRLADGGSRYEGRVEVFYATEWGTICDDEWDSNDAAVICRQLGFTGGIALVDLEFGPGKGDIFLDNVDCSGDETTLLNCSLKGWAAHNCVHGEDAGVRCG